MQLSEFTVPTVRIYHPWALCGYKTGPAEFKHGRPKQLLKYLSLALASPTATTATTTVTTTETTALAPSDQQAHRGHPIIGRWRGGAASSVGDGARH